MYVKICPFFKLQNHLKVNGSYLVNMKRKKQPKWKLNKEVKLLLDYHIFIFPWCNY